MSKISRVFARQILDSRGNPTIEVDVLTINGIEGKEIQLFDANGKLIKKLPFSNSFSTSELTSGVYYLEINQDKTITRIRFCKVN
jgi:hypothetical protein